MQTETMFPSAGLGWRDYLRALTMSGEITPEVARAYLNLRNALAIVGLALYTRPLWGPVVGYALTALHDLTATQVAFADGGCPDGTITTSVGGPGTEVSACLDRGRGWLGAYLPDNSGGLALRVADYCRQVADCVEGVFQANPPGEKPDGDLVTVSTPVDGTPILHVADTGKDGIVTMLFPPQARDGDSSRFTLIPEAAEPSSADTIYRFLENRVMPAILASLGGIWLLDKFQRQKEQVSHAGRSTTMSSSPAPGIAYMPTDYGYEHSGPAVVSPTPDSVLNGLGYREQMQIADHVAAVLMAHGLDARATVMNDPNLPGPLFSPAIFPTPDGRVVVSAALSHSSQNLDDLSQQDRSALQDRIVQA
ncbi:MAG: hypothetical protein HY459_00525, partial [Parcubacteria group bacterium]|nr:hypothetical protein [Parcubacteria group bacterium]